MRIFIFAPMFKGCQIMFFTGDFYNIPAFIPALKLIKKLFIPAKSRNHCVHLNKEIEL